MKFCTKLEEALTSLRFFNQCAERKEYWKHFWTLLRRQGIKPTRSALQQHLVNKRDVLSEYIKELNRLKQQYSRVTDTLSDLERHEFVSYADDVARRRAEQKWQTLQKSINSNQIRPTFPDHPERYVKNFSSVQLDKTMLEVLSLGPKFCIP